jgi:hypothetical protein
MTQRRRPRNFVEQRRLAWQRHSAQARFRGEEYLITEEYWNQIWPEERFLLRGMRGDSLCLTRRYSNRPWQPGNLMLMTRQNQIAINNRLIHDIDNQALYNNTLWSDLDVR